MKRKLVLCPGCGRNVWTLGGRYDTHQSGASGLAYCFMSGMPQPVIGRSIDGRDMEERAKIVACLAAEVQDADPAAVWRYLGVMPPLFVRELLQLALAGLPVEGKQVNEIWKRWDAA